jgi:hypothetical protein
MILKKLLILMILVTSSFSMYGENGPFAKIGAGKSNYLYNKVPTTDTESDQTSMILGVEQSMKLFKSNYNHIGYGLLLDSETIGDISYDIDIFYKTALSGSWDLRFSTGMSYADIEGTTDINGLSYSLGTSIKILPGMYMFIDFKTVNYVGKFKYSGDYERLDKRKLQLGFLLGFEPRQK